MKNKVAFPDMSIENQHSGIVAGVDEAGRGPWAGPVVAGAVIIPDCQNMLKGINDSKKLSQTKRELLYEEINANFDFGVGIIDVDIIDRVNILQATMQAMKQAVESLKTKPDLALIDGTQAPELACKSICITKGDSKSISIAAASIIAKVTRDRIMKEASEEYPEYGFDSNSGYGTKSHIAALDKYGITPLHRKSFAPIRRIIENAA